MVTRRAERSNRFSAMAFVLFALVLVAAGEVETANVAAQERPPSVLPLAGAGSLGEGGVACVIISDQPGAGQVHLVFETDTGGPLRVSFEVLHREGWRQQAVAAYVDEPGRYVLAFPFLGNSPAIRNVAAAAR